MFSLEIFSTSLNTHSWQNLGNILRFFLKGCQHEIAVALSLKKMFFKVYRLLVGLKKRLEYLNYSCVCALNSWPIPCVLTIVEGAFLFEGQQQHGVVKV